jgi:imidazolonepropionase-like amidohydrolase
VSNQARKTAAFAGVLLGMALLIRANPEERPLVIRGGKIFTVTGGILENGLIIISGGKIQAVGKDLAVPPEARVIDASQDCVFPGFFDAGTNLGTVEFESSEEDYDESAVALTPQLSIIDSIDPENRFIPAALRRGITSALIAPGRGNVLSGQSAVLHLDGADLETMTLKSPAAVHGSLGDVIKPRSKRSGAYPYTRMGVAAALRQSLVDAGASLARLQRADRGKKEEDPAIRALFPVIKGEIPLVITANRFDDIMTALRIAAEFKIRIVINEGADAHRAAAELAARKVPVVLRTNTAYRLTVETLGAVAENAARLERAGVRIAFQSGSTQDAGDFWPQVHLAVTHGLAPEAALRALTLNPAAIFGLADLVGSLEPGKSADVVIFPANPIMTTVPVKWVIVGGKIAYEKEPSR